MFFFDEKRKNKEYWDKFVGVDRNKDNREIRLWFLLRWIEFNWWKVRESKNIKGIRVVLSEEWSLVCDYFYIWILWNF